MQITLILILILILKFEQKEIVSVNFTIESPGTQANGSWLKSVPNYILPKVRF